MGTITAIIGFIAVVLGKPYYRLQPLGNSPLVKIAQVIVVAIRNGSLTVPENPDELFEISDKDRDPGKIL
ncbi:hypothetical protein Patl1_16601 [Pistacia atlantica]|uniref:Uncharacterized protein n=1 Tax=Pistacia atlantica TaxID=434234 RepID=A0ACC1BB20_9ROSI|nr:hypothetical protein Patl1_16601 [Pistacia atlantica]